MRNKKNIHQFSFMLNKSFLLANTSDIDECSEDSSPCDENADCTNSDGSYSCTCKQGFSGDGTTCDGKRECSNNHNTFLCEIN